MNKRCISMRLNFLLTRDFHDNSDFHHCYCCCSSSVFCLHCCLFEALQSPKISEKLLFSPMLLQFFIYFLFFTSFHSFRFISIPRIAGCENGCSRHGQCTLEDGEYKCVCIDGWAGHDCSIQLEMNCNDNIDNDHGKFIAHAKCHCYVVLCGASVFTFST